MEIFLVWVVLAVVVGVIANNKGRTGFGWFMLSLLFSPFLVGLIVLVMPKVGEAAYQRDEAGQPVTADTHTRCPACRELVRKDASKCKHCGSALVPTL